ncbi:peptide-methionine (S)-S-oxide reductase MsrA [Psychroflexus maritimus]|uniref:Peptide methionine sulfoxide reductase MsrA n=1 Tax=Psychroflexus maritimus TaxID=2714865 RepID=A0A967AG92_9FLAO|nr:peptide-methionine (S)-S-oxide reductase MsrA [Psychroflexus maritimus]NGZ88875.1 peptide-methionine (S)-S-oxide reductase MsrA [Psychroflexus maritimus]
MNLQTATLANGCFWCTEAVFQRLNGVIKVQSGFTGGKIKNPPYREVVMGRTGHAEAIQVEFDEEVVSYKTILKVFFSTHDPTTLNRQGYDVGTQYRSAIFYHSQKQKQTAMKLITNLNKDVFTNQPIVTEVTAASTFYQAEKDHQNFYNNNSEFRYCQLIIDPKLNHIKEHFAHLLK